MDIQTFLTHFINLMVIITIAITLIDFCFHLLRSWRQINPPTQSVDFYRAVKDLLWDEPELATSTT